MSTLQCSSLASTYGKRRAFHRWHWFFILTPCICTLLQRKNSESLFISETDWWFISSIYLSIFWYITWFCPIQEGITLLIINFSNQTRFTINIYNSINYSSPTRINQTTVYEESALIRVLKKSVSFIGIRASLFREEYHLTPKDGFLQSRTMLLNGTPLEMTEEGKIPTLKPVLVEETRNSSLSIAPLSIAFVVLPYFEAPACSSEHDHSWQ